MIALKKKILLIELKKSKIKKKNHKPQNLKIKQKLIFQEKMNHQIMILVGPKCQNQ